MNLGKAFSVPLGVSESSMSVTEVQFEETKQVTTVRLSTLSVVETMRATADAPKREKT